MPVENKDGRGGNASDTTRRYRKNLTVTRAVNNLSDADIALLEACARAQNDFEFFCHALVGVRVHPGQLQVVENMGRADYGVLAAANSWGKTFLYALICLWATFTKQWAPLWWQQYRAVVLGPWMSHSLLCHNHIENLRFSRHEAQHWDGKNHRFLLASRLIPFITKSTHSAFRWRHNNSIINFESAEQQAQAIEGWQANLIVYDEARLEMHLKFIVDEVLLARAVRAPHMKILLGSTPLMDSYDFYEYFKKADNGFEDWWSYKGKIEDNIFLNKEQVEKIRRNLDERVSQQVLSGEFVQSPDAYFVSERVMEAFDDTESADLSRLTGRVVEGHTYVGGLDTAVAEMGDYSVLTIWDVTTTPHRLIFEKVFEKGTATSTVVSFCDVAIQEFGCQIGYDATGPLGVEFGHQVANDASWYVPIKFSGFSINGKNVQKTDALANFRYFINNKLWRAPSIPGLRAQILAYRVKDKSLKKDRLMAQVYAAWVAKDFLTPDQMGMYLDDMKNMFSGSGSPFSKDTYPEAMSDIQRKWVEIVRQGEIREEQIKMLKAGN